MSAQVQCPNDSCIPSRSGGFCLVCGRAFRNEPVPDCVLQAALADLELDDIELDPEDPNYWVYLMHDIEIIAEPVAAPANAGLAFYGTTRTRR